MGCDIPYTGDTLSVQDVDKYLEKTGGDTVCLNDGFDSLCLKVIPGPRGKKGDTGQPGVDGVDGIDGKDGVDGKDGADNIVPEHTHPHDHPAQDHAHPHAHDLPDHSHPLQTHSHTHHHDVPIVNTGHSAEAVPSQPQENNVQETGFVATTPPPVSSPPVAYTPPPVSTLVVSTPQPIPERHPQPAEEPEPVDDALPEACGRWTTDSHEHDNNGLVSDFSAEQDRRNLHASLGRRFREYYDVDEWSCGFHYHGDDHSDAHRHSSRANY